MIAGVFGVDLDDGTLARYTQNWLRNRWTLRGLL